MIATCAVCGKEIERRESLAYPVSGWEAARGQGGANRIIDRERDETVVAHLVCVESRADRRRRGISDGQMGFA